MTTPWILSLLLTGDVTLETDHPRYPGEGVFQTVEGCVRFATRSARDDNEKAIALWRWLLGQQCHLASPQEWWLPGRTPDSRRDDPELIVADANRARFSFGYGLCGTVHAWNEPYWKALGMRARRRAFPGHTNSEVEYGGAWHAVDTDMAGIILRHDGVIAGYDDLIREPGLIDRASSSLPRYPFAWPGDFNGMKAGWRQVAAGGTWFSLYNGAAAAQPAIVNLRRGETFTRFAHPDGFGSAAKRRFWHVQSGGPSRDWSYVGVENPTHEAARSNARNLTRHGNAIFDYRPDLTGELWRQGTSNLSDPAPRGSPGGLRAVAGGVGSVTFEHLSPYVIAGDPEDDANPMTGRATGGLVVSGSTTGAVRVELSVDFGQTWAEAGSADGDFELDLTERVKGRYGWLVRFGWSGAGGVDRLRFITTCQTAAAILPRVKPNGTEVIYRARPRAVTARVPNWAPGDSAAARAEVESSRSPNLRFVGRTASQRVAYQIAGPKPAHAVFELTSATPLVRVAAALRFQIRSPTAPGSSVTLELSEDEGRTWRQFAAADLPVDNEFSSGWVGGDTPLSASKVSRAHVRVRLFGGGYPVGLIRAELYGVRDADHGGETTIRWRWKENGMPREHVEKIPVGGSEHRFQLPTGPNVTDDAVIVERR
jgi:hypothetical protein